MKKVYLINLSFGLAGIERRFANLWRALRRRRNVDPVLVIPSVLAVLLRKAGLLPADDDGIITIDEPRILTWLGGLQLPPLFDTPVAILRSRVAAIAYRRFFRRIAQEPQAVIHIGMNCSALRPPELPAVYECVDANLEQFETRHYRRAALRRSVMHCQTDRIRLAVDDLYRQRDARWQTVTNPIYFAHYDAPSPAKDRDIRRIAFVGRLAAEKNPLMFIDALALARKEVDCNAVMLGEGPLRLQCEDRIERHGLGAVVRSGFVPDPIAELRASSVYVSLQNGDNYGSQALLEAMGAGCAIIASDVGETRKIVTDDVGVCVALTPESIAEAVVRLLRSPEETRQRGRNAERIARTKYSADAYAEFLERLYDVATQYHAERIESPDALSVR